MPNKLRKITLLPVALSMLLASCGDRIDLDKSLIVQVLALDQTEAGKLRTFYTAPTFAEQSAGAGATEVMLDKSDNSLRKMRQKIMADSGSNLLSGKIRVILVTGRFLQNRYLFEELNVLFRDPINPNDAVLAYTDSPLEDIFSTKQMLHPNNSSYIQELIRAAHNNGLTTDTTLERYNYLHFNKGMTPALPEIRSMEGHLRVPGVVLLSKEGKYKARLQGQLASLLLILLDDATTPLNYSFSKDDKEISFDMLRTKTKFGTEFRNDRFHFTVKVNLSINVSEYTKEQSFLDQEEAIVRDITNELQTGFDKVIRICQEARVDPVGFGMRARAYEYDRFREVEDRWPETFAKAEVGVIPVVKVKRFGIIK